MEMAITQFQHIDYAVNKLRNYLKAKSRKALVITRQNLFSFVTGGEENVINVSSEYTNVTVIITETVKIVAYPVGETGTLNFEVLRTAGFLLEPYCFLDVSDRQAYIQKMVGTDEIVSDQPGLFECCYQEIITLTLPLTEYAQEIYAQLCKLCETALKRFCMEIRPDMTECEARAFACGEFIKMGIEPVVLLIGNGERVCNTRHFISGMSPVGKRIIIIACIKYRGLVLSFTRDLFFRPITQEEKDMCLKLAYLGALMQAETVSGKSDTQLHLNYYDAYSKAGLKNSFFEHPCAGYTGYETRISWITDSSSLILQNNDAIAINPSINGYKSEDTYIMKNGVPHRLSIGIWPDRQFIIEGQLINKAMPLILI